MSPYWGQCSLYAGLEYFEVALRGGFEPPTPWFVAKYSIQLSYRSAEAGHILSAPRESNT